MLLPENIHPINSLYFNGAYVLAVLRANDALTLVDLFVEFRKLHKIHLPLFVLTLDWLFLAGLISHDEQGNIQICS